MFRRIKNDLLCYLGSFKNAFCDDDKRRKLIVTAYLDVKVLSLVLAVEAGTVG